jgi:hypothetical protein
MATIGKVSAVFTASSSGLVAGVNQSARAMQRLQGSINSVASSSRALVAIQGAQLFGSMASGASHYVRQLVGMGSAQAQVIDQQSKMASRLGMTYGELAGIGHAANLSGVSMEQVANAATKADVALVKAVNGSASAAAQFTNMGLSIDQLNKMNAADRFKAIADGIAQMPSQAERSAVAVALFGRAGAELLPLFSSGAGAIASAADEAERFGLTLKNAQGKDVEAMNDGFTRAGEAVKGIVGQVVSYLAPAVTGVTEQFIKMIGTAGGANIGQSIGEGIIAGARWFAGIGDWFIANMGSTWAYVSQVGQQWGGVVEAFNRVGSFMSGVFNGAQMFLGGIVLGFTGLVQMMMEGLKLAADYLGGSQYLDDQLSELRAFNDSMVQSIQQDAAAAADGFYGAFASDAPGIGKAVAGPMTAAFDSYLAKAKEAAASLDTAAVASIAQTTSALSGSSAAAAVAEDRQAVKAIDSRSAEGVAEMFRLMRGRPNGAAERTAKATEDMSGTLHDIRDNLADEVLLALV